LLFKFNWLPDIFRLEQNGLSGCLTILIMLQCQY